MSTLFTSCRNAYCGYCGNKFGEDIISRGIYPRNCTSCGKRTYNNPHFVVVVLLPVKLVNSAKPAAICIKRSINPFKDQYALPGGYVTGPAIRLTPPQHCINSQAVLEVFEETGIQLDEHSLKPIMTVGPAYNSAIYHFLKAPILDEDKLPPFIDNPETSERIIVTDPNFKLAFPEHQKVLSDYLRNTPELEF